MVLQATVLLYSTQSNLQGKGPSRTSKAKDHLLCVERMKAWHNGDISELVAEGAAIQMQLRWTQSRKQNDDTRLANRFNTLMSRGKVRDALRLLKDDGTAVVLNSGIVLYILRDKHPTKSILKEVALVDPDRDHLPSHLTEFDSTAFNCTTNRPLMSRLWRTVVYRRSMLATFLHRIQEPLTGLVHVYRHGRKTPHAPAV